MPFIPTPNCVSAELVFAWNGQVCENVLHYVKASPWNTDQMTELAEQLKDTWNANTRTEQSDQLSLTAVKITDLSSQTAPVVVYTTGLPIAGASLSPSLPNNCALVITKRTLLRGRSYRGRIYHMGLTEAQVQGNTVLPASVSAIRNTYDPFLAVSLPVAVDEALLVVLSLQNAGVPRTEGVATLVQSLTTDGVLDSQRRRLPGRGQ